MLQSETNSQVLSADGQVPFGEVDYYIPFWQVRGGTFPVFADNPAGSGTGEANSGESTDGDEHESDTSGDGADPQIARLRRDAARYRTELRQAQAQLTELEDLRKRVKDREDAEKSELEKAQARADEAERKATAAEQQLTETRNRQAIERAAAKAGAADADDVFQLLKPKDFELDDEGHITNADDLVKDLLKAKPYLVAQTTTTTRGNTAGPKPSGSSTTYAEVVKGEEKRLRQSGAINI